MTVIIILILFIINAIVLYFGTKNYSEVSPKQISNLEDSITENNGIIKIKNDALDYVNKNYQWMMILDNDGKVAYKNNLPKELDHTYTVGEVSEFSKWYLEDYPVTTVESPYGLIVLAKEKGSIWISNISISSNMIIPSVIIIILANIVIGALLSLIFSLIFFKDLKVVIKSITKLSNNEPQHINEKGYLQDVYSSINTVSENLSNQMDEINSGKEMKAKWLQGVSHDIRTPLSIISGNSEFLLENSTDDIEKSKLELICNQCFKIKNLLADLNLISSLENNINIRKADMTNIDCTIRNCIADIMNAYDLDKYNISFASKLQNNNSIVEGDEKLLIRAFNNIITNSIKHNQNGCAIDISSEIIDSNIKLTFSDNGIGIDSKQKIELQNKNSNNSEHGWGLIVVKEIVKLHEGYVDFEDSSNGFTVCIYLPVKC